MAFTSELFLIGLLPFFVIVCVALGKINNSKIILLAIANCIFYVYGGVGAFLFLLVFSVCVWTFVEIVRATRNRAICGISIGLTVIPLVLMKYATFAISTINGLLDYEMTAPSLMVPLGISFYTFEAISLISDVYW